MPAGVEGGTCGSICTVAGTHAGAGATARETCEEGLMMKKMAKCEHCGGMKTCTASGGRSCVECLRASGQGKRSHAAVRCSYCGGRGFVMVEEEEEPSGPPA